MTAYTDDTRQMMTAYQQQVRPRPGFAPPEERLLRQRLLREEYTEYCCAEEDDDLVGVYDALVDMLVIIHGTALAYGLDLDAGWDIVHRSNMSKVDPVTGTVTKRQDGKVIKPAHYVDARPLLRQQIADDKAGVRVSGVPYRVEWESDVLGVTCD